jgi:Zn-dependent protease with chaperone function
VFVPLPAGTAANEWLRQMRHPSMTAPTRSSGRRLALSLVLLVALCIAMLVGGWYGLRYGTTAIAGWAAPKIPVEWEEQLGKDGITMLEAEGFKPSGLSDERKAQLRTVFLAAKQAALAQHPTSPMLQKAKLEFRSSPMGPNAFALPGGLIVMTDEMVKLAEPLGKDADNGLMGVFAHELGHVHHRHVIQNLLSQSITAGAIFLIVGDISGLSGLAVLLPTVLLNSAHSREFEAESDDFAIATLDYAKRATLPMAALFEKLEAWIAEKRAGGENDKGTEKKASDDKSEPKKTEPGKLEKIGSYLQTHPATQDRIEKLRKANKH